MGKIALNVTLEHPVFGAGLGRFWELSNVYMNNAHNNFLQISAELGIPAVLLFVLVGGLAVRASWRDTERWGPARGLSMGLAVFLLTCMAGHPLLISGAAYPFWMALGFAAIGDRGPALSTRVRLAGIAAILVIAINAAPSNVGGHARRERRACKCRLLDLAATT